MAIITDQLQQVLQTRNPPRVDIAIEAEPGQGSAVREALEDLGVSFDSVNVRQKTVFQATVTQEELEALNQTDAVLRLDHSPSFQPLGVAAPPVGEARAAEGLERITLRDAIERMEVPAAWESLGNRGEGVRVGMVDTPISEGHEAIEDSVVDTERNTGSALHGTWVASATVADRFETPDGPIQGVAPDAELVAHGALSGGGASITEIAEGLNYCINQNCDIINLSLGGQHSEILRSVVQEALQSGSLVVSSIGNSGPSEGSGTCPAHHGEVLSVGSIDARGNPASFSSRGPGWDGETKPDLVAFGGGSRLSGGEQLVTETVLGAAPPNTSQYLVGTSMAGPQVAGICALRAAAEKE